MNAAAGPWHGGARPAWQRALEGEQGLKSVQVWFSVLLLVLLGACNAPPPEQLFKQGQQLAAEGKHAEAVIQTKSALQARPDWPEARLALSRSLLALGQREAAEGELGRLISDASVGDQALPLYLESLLVGGEAKRIVTQHANHRPARPEAMADYQALLAAAWLALGQLDKAQASLNEAIRANPDDVRARVMQARAQASAGQLDKAAASIQELLRTQGGAKEAWTLHGDLLQARAQPDLAGARDAYAKALQLDKAHVPAHAALVQMALRNGDTATASKQAAAMQAAVPGHPLTILTVAQLAFAENQLDKAREHTQALLSVFPDLPSALHLAGMLELRRGSASQAIRHFRKALTIDTSLTVTREALAEAELRLGQPGKALESLAVLLADEPVGVRALALAADARLQLGDPAGAEALYLKAARAQPDDVRLRIAAAVARIQRGAWSEAVGELESIAGRTSVTFADEALYAARLRRGEYDQALALVDAMEKKQPERSVRWLEMRGTVHLQRLDFAKARESFERAGAARPESYVAVGHLVELDVLQGQPQAALQRLEAYLRTQPQHPSALLALALLSSKQPSLAPDTVRARFAASIQAAPSEPMPRLRFVEYLLRRNQFKEALAVAQEANAAIPEDARLLDALGRAQGRAGDVEQAVKTFRKVAAMLPASPEPHLRLAELYRAGSQLDQARTAYRRALDINPASSVALQGLVETLLMTSRPPEVLAQIERARSARPNSPSPYSMESLVHLQRKDVDSAIRALRTGFQRTGSRELGSQLVSQLLRAGKVAEAEAELAAWLRRVPNDPEARYLQSAISLLKGDLPLAERQLTQLVQLDPRNASALNNLAALVADRSPQEAVAYARRALEQEPDNPAILDTLASALAADKKLDEAKVVHARAMQLAPGDPNLRLTRAKLALLVDDKALARAEIAHLEGLGAAFPRSGELAKLKARL